jgi:hypothetical protein
MHLHLTLTKKNGWLWASGVSGLLLIAIGFLVPTNNWGLHPWRWIILALLFVGVVGTTVQILLQSKEDVEKDEKENERDKAQLLIANQVAQLTNQTQQNSTSPQLFPPVQFDASGYFRTAYHSQFTADIEKRIGIAADQNKQQFATDEFYRKFIGVGLVAYFHDITWAYIWKSQMLMLEELNRHGGIMPLAEAKKFYDQAVIDYPSNYKTYSFDQWLNFMLAQTLMIRHPSDMLEITVRGRDYLSYSAHWARFSNSLKG